LAGQRPGDDVDDTRVGRPGRRRPLRDPDLSGLVVVEDQVGERPTDVYTKTSRHSTSCIREPATDGRRLPSKGKTDSVRLTSSRALSSLRLPDRARGTPSSRPLSS